MTGYVAHTGKMRNAYKTLIIKPEKTMSLTTSQNKLRQKCVSKIGITLK